MDTSFLNLVIKRDTPVNHPVTLIFARGNQVTTGDAIERLYVSTEMHQQKLAMHKVQHEARDECDTPALLSRHG